jgi:hypothetical protein
MRDVEIAGSGRLPPYRADHISDYLGKGLPDCRYTPANQDE